MSIADRVRELRFVNSSELLPNPKNWRLHPEFQREALCTMLEEVGIADAVICRETDDGLMLIDGHLRQEELDQDVACLVVDLSEEEADEMLATLDPIAGMAERDSEAFSRLAEEVDADTEAFSELMADLGLTWLSDSTDPEPEPKERNSVFGSVKINKVLATDGKRLMDEIRSRLPDGYEVLSF